MSTWSTVKATMWPLVVFILELSGVTCELDYERENDWIWISGYAEMLYLQVASFQHAIAMIRSGVTRHENERITWSRKHDVECGSKLLGSWVLNIEYGDYLME